MEPLSYGSFRDLTLAEFNEKLASPDPVPGGGSASAVAASVAASLVAMVASLSLNRPKYAEHNALHEVAAPGGLELAKTLLALADEDAVAYAACSFALKLPREAFEDREHRDQQVRATSKVAAEVPLKVVERCRDLLVYAEALAGRSNMNASSDLRVAALLAEAAGHGAAENVLVNLPLVGDDPWVEVATARVNVLLTEIAHLKDRVHEIVSNNERRPPLDALPEVAA